MSDVDTDNMHKELGIALVTITLDEVNRLREIEHTAREAARYHVSGYGGSGYGGDAIEWNAEHMLGLMDKLAKVLNE